ncbi:PaaI family thioesterase [Candidatus Fermentibacteria bacterium]|nr:PaaI family thioesterase [Candidatus Fermentibacteria bacterium]
MTDKPSSLEYRHCFVCGRENSRGLRLSPVGKEGRGLIEWVPTGHYEGYDGILHGGLISTLLDEAMAYAVMSVVGSALTVRIDVRFIESVAIGSPVRITAELLEERGRTVTASAELAQEGRQKAKGKATFWKTEAESGGGPD